MCSAKHAFQNRLRGEQVLAMLQKSARVFLASPRAGIIQDVRFVGTLCSLEAQTAVVKWLVPYVEIDPSINDLPPRRIVPSSSV